MYSTAPCYVNQLSYAIFYFLILCFTIIYYILLTVCLLYDTRLLLFNYSFKTYYCISTLNNNLPKIYLKYTFLTCTKKARDDERKRISILSQVLRCCSPNLNLNCSCWDLILETCTVLTAACSSATLTTAMTSSVFCIYLRATCVAFVGLPLSLVVDVVNDTYI